jgi:hypothetical protein
MWKCTNNAWVKNYYCQAGCSAIGLNQKCKLACNPGTKLCSSDFRSIKTCASTGYQYSNASCPAYTSCKLFNGSPICSCGPDNLTCINSNTQRKECINGKNIITSCPMGCAVGYCNLCKPGTPNVCLLNSQTLASCTRDPSKGFYRYTYKSCQINNQICSGNACVGKFNGKYCSTIKTLQTCVAGKCTATACTNGCRDNGTIAGCNQCQPSTSAPICTSNKNLRTCALDTNKNIYVFKNTDCTATNTTCLVNKCAGIFTGTKCLTTSTLQKFNLGIVTTINCGLNNCITYNGVAGCKATVDGCNPNTDMNKKICRSDGNFQNAYLVTCQFKDNQYKYLLSTYCTGSGTNDGTTNFGCASGNASCAECQPNLLKCSMDGKSKLTCGSDSKIKTQACNSGCVCNGNNTDYGGCDTVTCKICDPGNTYCHNNQDVRTCSADGTSETIENCNFGCTAPNKFCNQCNTPGVIRCLNSSSAALCGSDLKFGEVKSCPNCQMTTNTTDAICSSTLPVVIESSSIKITPTIKK